MSFHYKYCLVNIDCQFMDYDNIWYVHVWSYDNMYVYSVYIHIFILNYILYLYDNMIIYDNPQIFWILIKSAPGAEGLEGLIAGCR